MTGYEANPCKKCQHLMQSKDEKPCSDCRKPAEYAQTIHENAFNSRRIETKSIKDEETVRGTEPISMYVIDVLPEHRIAL